MFPVPMLCHGQLYSTCLGCAGMPYLVVPGSGDMHGEVFVCGHRPVYTTYITYRGRFMNPILLPEFSKYSCSISLGSLLRATRSLRAILKSFVLVPERLYRTRQELEQKFFWSRSCSRRIASSRKLSRQFDSVTTPADDVSARFPPRSSVECVGLDGTPAEQTFERHRCNLNSRPSTDSTL
jgi:hypothetical protein